MPPGFLLSKINPILPALYFSIFYVNIAKQPAYEDDEDRRIELWIFFPAFCTGKPDAEPCRSIPGAT